VLDLNEVVRGVEGMIRRLLGTDVEIATRLAADLGRVRADAAQLEQVILNLVVNARDAMPRGGRLTIETADVELDADYARRHAAVVAGPYVMLGLSDTGHGMDEATQARLFDPFFTTKAQGLGTGLGLATVYGIVQQSGGNIWVYSEPGRGTTFRIHLPRIEAELEPAPPALRRPAAGSRGDETILLVEDQESLRKLVTRVLENAGYTVLAAADGPAALAAAENHGGPIQLLLTDVVMPQMSGPELVERLRRERPELRALLMSGYTEDAVLREGELPAATGFLGKPFTSANLAATVRAALDA
jgi:CheY-like chemotaxis protein